MYRYVFDLCVSGWVPVWIIEDHSICPCQINTKATNTSCQEKHKDRAILYWQIVHSSLILDTKECKLNALSLSLSLSLSWHWLQTNCNHMYLIKFINEGLPRWDGCGPIHAAVGVPPTGHKALQNVQHHLGLREEEHPVTLLPPKPKERLNNYHLTRTTPVAIAWMSMKNKVADKKDFNKRT